jgi:ectoine hydroxylase-related dioxygenase (phytanoyl-CoA dioxygenase family)
MSDVLTPELASRFRSDGFTFPMRGISEDAARAWRERYEFYESLLGFKGRPGILRQKAHLAFPFMLDLIRNEAILDAIEALAGPNLLCVASVIWVKNPGDGKFVSWHQDVAYNGFDPGDGYLSWTALTESTAENGCVQFIPRSHTWPLGVHDETRAAENLLSRGQSLSGIDASTAVRAELKPGEFSLHHERTIHGSEPNRSAERRIGFTGLYIPTTVRSNIGRRSALLVRGKDEYQHWDPEPTPRFDLDPISLEFSAKTIALYTANRPQAAATN